MDVTMDSIRETYRRYSWFYDYTFVPLLHPGRKTAVEKLKCRPGERVLIAEIQRVCKPGGTIVLLNHFQNRNPWVRRVEKLLQPFAKYVGFHPDFPLEDFVKATKFRFREKFPVNAFDYWTVLVGHNQKKTRAIH